MAWALRLWSRSLLRALHCARFRPQATQRQRQTPAAVFKVYAKSQYAFEKGMTGRAAPKHGFT